MYVSVGMNLVWTSPSLLELKSSLRLETNEEAAILSSFPFGAFLGPITGILLSDRLVFFNSLSVHNFFVCNFCFVCKP